MKTLQIKAILTTIIMVLFSLSVFSGIGLFVAPMGRVAHETGWTFFGLDKDMLEKLHTLPSMLMAGLIPIHLYLNWKMYLGELKSLSK